jgi:hypothetical protein
MPGLITENVINVSRMSDTFPMNIFRVSDTFPIAADLVRTSVFVFFVTTQQGEIRGVVVDY